MDRLTWLDKLDKKSRPFFKPSVHCSFCFGALSGSLIERRFSAVDETRAVLAQAMIRDPGFIACFLPSGPNIHQMVNASDSEAVSLHIYSFDHRLNASSIHREYRAV